MIRLGILVLALTTGALLPKVAIAHERGDRARGVVERVDRAEIAVKASDGHVVAFVVTADTRFTRGDSAATLDEVDVGERVVVEGRRSGERLEAVRVKLGASRNAPAR